MAECELAKDAENRGLDDKQFTCSICIGHYNHPRYLPTCGHTFCENCLLKYTRNVQQEEQGSRFDCPVCKKPNDLPEQDEVTLKWVQKFPLNTVIIKMMESLPKSSEAMDEERRVCDPCREEGEITTGLKYCLDCKEVLCEGCIKCHKKFKATKAHTLIDVTEMSAKTNTDFFQGIGKCAVHPGRDLDVYCGKHDTVACALCFIADHKSCEMTDIASHNIDVTKLQNDSERLVSQMKAAIAHVDHLQKLRVEIQSNLKQKLNEIKDNIKHVRDQVVELMDAVVSQVSVVAKQIEIEKEDRINAEMARVMQLKDQTEQNVALLGTIGQHGSERHKFVSVHMMKSKVEEINQKISEEDKHVKHFDAKLEIADQLRKLTECTEARKLVEIKMNDRKSSHTPFVSVLTPPRGTGAVSVLAEATGTKQKSNTRSAEPMMAPPGDTDAATNVLRDSKLVKTEEHVVDPDTRFYPKYYGVSVNKDGRIILCDEGTSLLCLFNPANGNLLRLTMTGRPYSVVEIGDSRLAVSSRDNRTIRIVTVGNELRVEKTLKTRYQPGSIVALDNGELAVAWRDPPAFGVIHISGAEVIERTYMDQDTSGRRFKSFRYMAVDERRQHVIQSCNEDRAIHCFDFKGKPVFKYKHPVLTDPRGVALDKCGNIYVCQCSDSGSIHKLSPTGEPISVITEDVPRRPLAICSDVTGTGFWLTQIPFDFLHKIYGISGKIVYFKLK